MTRGIPSVKQWRVTYWRDGSPVLRIDTYGPTKYLAQMNARDSFVASRVWRGGQIDRVTIGLIRKPRKART
jgi:hypothetical protein